MLAVIGGFIRMLSRDITRVEDSVRALSEDVTKAAALADASVRESVEALDTRIQSEIQIYGRAQDLRIAATETRLVALEGLLRGVETLALNCAARLDAASEKEHRTG